MKILTTVKKVVDVELTIHVDNGNVVEDGLQYVINAWDESGVEESVQLKENHKAETTAVSIGGGEVTEIIRRCYAMGIDKAMHVDDPQLEKADAFIYARTLQKVYENGDYDLIITGKQAQDTDNGQTGIILAENLGLPCVSNVVGIEVIDDSRLKVSRAGDMGSEIVEVELPAVLTVDVSINEPRLPSMRGIMMAKKKSFDQLDLSALGTSADELGCANPKSEVVQFMEAEKRQGGQKFEGDPAEITAKVVDLLANEAKVI